MPELKVADAHGFMLQGKLNNAMSTKGKSQSYEAKNGPGSLGKDFQKMINKKGNISKIETASEHRRRHHLPDHEMGVFAVKGRLVIKSKSTPSPA